MKYREAVERRWQPGKADFIVPGKNAFGIAECATIQTGQFQRGSNDCMGRVPVLDLEEVEALTEDPRFMFGLDAQALPRVQPSETRLQLL